MRTDEEFAREALRRAAIIRKRRAAKNQRIIAICSAASSLVVIVGISFLLPMTGGEAAQPEDFYGASLFADGAAGGYVIIGIVGFVLGVAVTLFVRRKSKGD